MRGSPHLVELLRLDVVAAVSGIQEELQIRDPSLPSPRPMKRMLDFKSGRYGDPSTAELRAALQKLQQILSCFHSSPGGKEIPRIRWRKEERVVYALEFAVRRAESELRKRGEQEEQ